MNWDIIEGKWNEYKGKAQAQWGKLTDDDLDVINGRRVELSGKIQQRYVLAKEEAERQIDDWTRRHKHMSSRSGFAPAPDNAVKNPGHVRFAGISPGTAPIT